MLSAWNMLDTHTHILALSWICTYCTAWAPLQFAWNDLSCVIYTRLPPVKGWMCSFNFFLFSIGFIFFLSALLLCLLRQSAFFFPSPFLCYHPVSENTITLAAPTAADADALNSVSLHCCNVREGGRGQVQRGRGEKTENVRGWEVCGCAQQVDRFKTASKVETVRLKKAVMLEPMSEHVVWGRLPPTNSRLVVLLLWSQAHHAVCPETY